MAYWSNHNNLDLNMLKIMGLWDPQSFSAGKAQQEMCFLCQQRKFNLRQELLILFYTITVLFSPAPNGQLGLLKDHQCHPAHPPGLEHLSGNRQGNLADSHPVHNLFDLLWHALHEQLYSTGHNTKNSNYCAVIISQICTVCTY